MLMGKSACEWMDTKYVLSYFGKTVSKARGQYNSYVKEGMELGRRPELVGGGLIRSLGGWEAIKKMRTDGQERVKGDQRILGDSGFVCDVLKEADEKFERYYEMKRLGYDLDTIEDRVCEIYKIEKEDLFSRSRQKVKSDARALFCFWAHRELGFGAKRVGEKAGDVPARSGVCCYQGRSNLEIKQLSDQKLSYLFSYDRPPALSPSAQ